MPTHAALSQSSLAIAATDATHPSLGVVRAAARHGTYDVELVTSAEAFERLEPEWNALFERSGTSTQLFQQFNWLWHALRQYCGRRRGPKPVIAIARDVHRRLVMAWPLQITCSRGLCHLSWLGEPVGQYGDVLIDDDVDADAVLAATWQQLETEIHPDFVDLRRVREDSKVSRFLTRLGALVADENQALALDLRKAGSLEAFAQEHHSRHFRKEQRRRMRRLHEMGNLRFERVVPGDQAAAVAREAVHLKRVWLAAKGLASKTLADDTVLSFFETVARDDKRPVGCEVHAAYLDDALIGAQIMFRCKQRLAVHVIVYDTAHQRTGIGNLQLAHSISAAFGRDIEIVDLLAPSADYKLDWSNTAVTVRDFAVPLTIRGRVYLELYVKRLRPKLKLAVPYLPKRIRRMAHL